MTTYSQPTLKPTSKIAAVGIAGIVTTLVPIMVILLNTLGVAGVDPDALSTGIINLIAAIVTIYNAVSVLIQFIAGYMKKEKKANQHYGYSYPGGSLI